MRRWDLNPRPSPHESPPLDQDFCSPNLLFRWAGLFKPNKVISIGVTGVAFNFH